MSSDLIPLESLSPEDEQALDDFVTCLQYNCSYRAIKDHVNTLKARGLDINLERYEKYVNAESPGTAGSPGTLGTLNIALNEYGTSHSKRLGCSALDYLVDHGVNINTPDHWGKNPLIYALDLHYDIDIIRRLVALGADLYPVDDRRSHFFHPLYYAIFHSEEAARYLISKYKEDNTPLSAHCTFLNDPFFFEKMIDKAILTSGVNGLNERNAYFDLAFEAFSDILTQENEDGYTPLMRYCAEYLPKESVILAFIERGADLSQPNSEGVRPVDIFIHNVIGSKQDFGQDNPRYQKYQSHYSAPFKALIEKAMLTPTPRQIDNQIDNQGHHQVQECNVSPTGLGL